MAQISDARGNEMRFLVSPLLAANLKSGQLLRVKAGAQELRARVVAVAADGDGGRRFTVLRAQAVDGPMPPAGTAVTAFCWLLQQSSASRFRPRLCRWSRAPRWCSGTSEAAQSRCQW